MTTTTARRARWMHAITLEEVQSALDHVKETAGAEVPRLVRYVDETNAPHCAAGRALAHLGVELPPWSDPGSTGKGDDWNAELVSRLAKYLDLRIEVDALRLLVAIQSVNDEWADEGNLLHPGESLTLAEIIDEGRTNYASVASYSA